MIAISIDEYGTFEHEQGKPSNEPIFVAGVIFDDKGNPEEIRRERKRICDYYRRTIADASGGGAGFEFPSALHVNEDVTNKKIVRLTKIKIADTIGEFLKNGTYKGQRINDDGTRKGTYYLYAYLCSDDGMTMFSKSNIMTDDDFAANRYYHMSTSIISRLALHNPLIKQNDGLILELATRASGEYDGNSKKGDELSRIGYNPRILKNNKKRFYLATPDMYRSFLAKEMAKSGKEDINVEHFSVEGINYKTNIEEDQLNEAFLFLADSVCAILSYEYKNKGSKDDLTYFNYKLDELIGSDRKMLFLYDDIDNIYQKAYEFYEEGNMYDSLQLCYVGSHYGKYAEYYSETWFDKIQSDIEKNEDISFLQQAVDRLNQSLYSNNLNQDQAVYIFKILERNVDYLTESIKKAAREQIIGKFYEAGISVFCHIGDSISARKYFDLYKKYVYATGIDDYLNVLNKLIGFQLDTFEWTQAEANAKEGLSSQRYIIELKNKMMVYKELSHETSLGLAKSYSLLGQVYAFNRNQMAENQFLMALDSLDSSSADYYITLSYLLHYYIDAGEHEKYMERATEYFGKNKTPSKQFSYLLSLIGESNPIINFKYGLYVFVKGIWTFKKDFPSELLHKLININQTINDVLEKSREKGDVVSKKSFKLSGHPSELIYKYIMLLAVEKGADDKADYLLGLCKESLENEGNTIKLIQLETERTYYEMISYDEKVVEFTKAEYELCLSEFPQLIPEREENLEAFHENLGSKLTFMYC